MTCPVGRAERFLAAGLALVLLARVASAQAGEAPPPARSLEPPLVPWSEAAAHVGERIAVEGEVARVAVRPKVAFLNFDRDWKGKLSVVLFPNLWPHYGDSLEEAFLGRRIRVVGEVEEYHGAPEIVVRTPWQIEFLDRPPGAVTGAEPRLERSADEVLLVTWNVENLFDSWDDPYHEDEVTAPTPRARRAALGAVLRYLDADVVCLQEVENRGLLEDFVAEQLPGRGYAVVLLEGNDGRGIDVAVLTRLPLLGVATHRHDRFPLEAEGDDADEAWFQRDLLEVRLGAPLDATVFTAHLKSQLGGEEADALRLAEARAAAAVAAARLAADPEARLLLVGDLNDVPGSDPLVALAGTGAPLRDLCRDHDRPSYLPERWSSRLDHVLVSPAAVALAPDGAHVVDLAAAGVPADASDHLPVLVRLRP